MPEEVFNEDKEVEDLKKFLFQTMRGNLPPSDVATLANAYFTIVSADVARIKAKQIETP